VSSHGQCGNYVFAFLSLSLPVFQFKYILQPFSCKANLQLTQNRMAYSILFSQMYIKSIEDMFPIV
jgi:hypothetical protein